MLKKGISMRGNTTRARSLLKRKFISCMFAKWRIRKNDVNCKFNYLYGSRTKLSSSQKRAPSKQGTCTRSYRRLY